MTTLACSKCGAPVWSPDIFYAPDGCHLCHDCANTLPPPASPRCAALESEVARLKEVVDWAGEVLARHAGVDAEAGEGG